MLFKLYKFYLYDGSSFEVIAHNLKIAIDDACFIQQIQEYEIREIKVVE